jgi:hypothetical protein
MVTYIINTVPHHLYGELHVLLREVKDCELQKRQLTHILLPIFTTVLVFSSSMHDRWILKGVYKMLKT